jgi:transcription antitermination factor NusG
MICSTNLSICDSPVPFVPRDPRWYAVYTYPRHEKTVTDHLRSKLIEVFLPTITTKSQWKDRRIQLETPVFPGYVFTRIDLSQRGKVVAVPGVVRILSFNGTPTPIDDREIDNVRLCLKSGVVTTSQASMGIGDRVKVRSGVLEGLEGYISRCKNDRRMIVPISLINQSIAVDIDVRLLDRVADEQFRSAASIKRQSSAI